VAAARGERGHLDALNGIDAEPYLETMVACASPCGLLPEQVWDVEAIPGRNLFPGRPSGSAMPLVWAHAEFIKLASVCGGALPAELLHVVTQRYSAPTKASRWSWRDATPVVRLPASAALLIEATEPFLLHYSFDEWATAADTIAVPIPFGRFGVLLDQGLLAPYDRLVFTRCAAGSWEGVDHRVMLR
jgi:glucoamylase